MFIIVAGSARLKIMSNTKNIAALCRPDVNPFMTRQTELGVVYWINAKVLCNRAIFCGPDLESEISHIGSLFHSGTTSCGSLPCHVLV